MFGRRGLFSRSAETEPGHRRTPFETEGSLRSVRYPVSRGSGPAPIDAIIAAVRRSEAETGRESLTNLERWIFEASLLDAYAVHQGGFDYYLAHVDGTDRWADAAGALYAMGLNGAADVMQRAVELFLDHDHGGAGEEAMQAYLDQMASLDRAFAALAPDLEASLAEFADRFYPYSDRAASPA